MQHTAIIACFATYWKACC